MPLVTSSPLPPQHPVILSPPFFPNGFDLQSDIIFPACLTSPHLPPSLHIIARVTSTPFIFQSTSSHITNSQMSTTSTTHWSHHMTHPPCSTHFSLKSQSSLMPVPDDFCMPTPSNSSTDVTAHDRKHSKMLPDVGMVQMYSKLASVNDLHGFCMDRLPPSLHGPALLLVPTVFLPGGLPCPSETHWTIPTSALVFGENIFRTLVSQIFMEYKLHMGNS